MVAGPGTRRPKGKAKAKATTKKQPMTDVQQAIKFDAKAGIKIGIAKSVKKVGEETLNSIHYEALNEIVEELIKNPRKILITARIVKNEDHFTEKVGGKTDWHHRTQLTLSCVPKSEWVLVLIEWRSKSSQPIWKEETIRLMDKFYNRRGIEHMVQFIGGFVLSDPIPRHCNYRPLLRATMVDHFVRSGVKLAINPKTGECTMDVYSLSGDEDGKQTTIKCNRSGKEIAIPSEYSVMRGSGVELVDNWSFLMCRLKGKRLDQNIYELFEEVDALGCLDYDGASFLDNTVLNLLPQFKARIASDIAQMNPEQKGIHLVDEDVKIESAD